MIGVAPEVDDPCAAPGPPFQHRGALLESVLLGVRDEFSQGRHLGESGGHLIELRGEGGDSNFRSRNLHSALLDLQAEVLPGEGNLRLLEHGPILLRSAPPISEGLQAIRQTHGDMPHDHSLEAIAEIVEILRLCCEIVLQAMSAEPFSLLEYDDPKPGVLHRNEAYHLSLRVRK